MSKSTKTILLLSSLVTLLVIAGIVYHMLDPISDNMPSPTSNEAPFSIDTSEVNEISFENWFIEDRNIFSDETQIAEIVKALNGFRYTERIESYAEADAASAEALLNQYNILRISIAGDDNAISLWIGESALGYLGDTYLAAEEGYFRDFIKAWFPEVPIDRYDEPQTLFSYDPETVDAIVFQSGSSGNRNDITDPDEIAELVETLNSFRYTEVTDAPDVSGWTYGIRVFESGSDEAQVLVMHGSIIDVDGKFYYSTEDGFFNDFIEMCPN